MQSRYSLRWLAAASLAVLMGSPSTKHATAAYVFAGGLSNTVFGVASYGGAPVPGIPTYILNNFTLLDDVLTSPGGGFRTADTSLPNNIADTGVVGIPRYSVFAGGGNANGLFGAGQVLLTPTLYAFTLRDVNPDGAGAAAYLVSSMLSEFTEDGTGFGGAPAISVGAWLAVAGIFGSPLSSAAASIKVQVNSLNPASPFFNGGLGRSYEVVLAAAAIGNFASVAYTAVNGLAAPTAVMLNDGVSPFAGLAVASEMLPTAGMIGDTVVVTSTLTVIADPMFVFSIDPTTDLLAEAGPLPAVSFVGTTFVPEPTSVSLSILGMLGIGATLIRRRRLPSA